MLRGSSDVLDSHQLELLSDLTNCAAFELRLPECEVRWRTPMVRALRNLSEGEKFSIPTAMGERFLPLAELGEVLLAPVVEVLRAGVACDNYELVQQLKTPSGAEHQMLVRVVEIEEARYLGILADVTDPTETPWVVADVADRLQLLVEHSPDAIIVHQDGKIVYANPAAAALVGEPSPRIGLGRDMTVYLHPDHVAPTIARLAQLSEPGAVVKGHEAVLRRLDGKDVPVEVASARTTWGGKVAYQVILRDISERKRADAETDARLAVAESLRASEDRFRTLAGAAPIGILEASAGSSVVYANARAAEIAGRGVESLMGRGWIDAVHPDDVPAVTTLFDGGRSNRRNVSTSFRITHPDGEVRHVRLSAAAKGKRHGGGYVVTVEDVTEEVQAQEALTHQTFYDALTGLPNRALFLDRLNQELARHRRSGSKIAVLFLDLDRFKIVNDSLGHDTGDAVLKSVGERLMEVIRAGETAARFSGDEFVFIIRDVDGAGEAVSAATRLLGVLDAPIRCAGQDLLITGSIGIVIPADDPDAAMILRDADTAMHKAKEAGGNRYELFDDDLHRRSVERLVMERELRHALERDELEVYYQPVVELPSGAPAAAEALIRWHHPERGLVPPLEFVPVAEDSGLIKPIGAWVFEQAVAQVAEWDSQHGGPRLGVIAVNLSARQMDDPDTSDMVTDVLERYGVTAGRVALEVTESIVMADSSSTRRSLETLKQLGLRVAIDDFGTGYSSLAYLHRLPVTTVKVDRSFVERLGSADDSKPVVQAIVDMSHAMGLRVVAEGVSERALNESVSRLGCDLAQGFYWARPMPAEKFAAWWRKAVKRASRNQGRS